MTAKLASLAVALLALAAAAAPAVAAGPFPNAVRAGPPRFDEADDLAKAVADAGRSAASKARDPWRHPQDSLTFWGLQAGAMAAR